MRALRKDETQEAIVKALRQGGCDVQVLHVPCDLLVRRCGTLYLLDCEGITAYRRRDTQQLENFQRWGVIMVKTPEAALRAVGALT